MLVEVAMDGVILCRVAIYGDLVRMNAHPTKAWAFTSSK